MSWFAFFLIVGSAGLHATWNLLAKKSVMTVSFYGAICMTACLMWIHTQFWTPVRYFDLPVMFWVYLLASVLSDLVCCLGLVRAYRTMEMSTAYPMMRSLPLLFVVYFSARFLNKIPTLCLKNKLWHLQSSCCQRWLRHREMRENGQGCPPNSNESVCAACFELLAGICFSIYYNANTIIVASVVFACYNTERGDTP